MGEIVNKVRAFALGLGAPGLFIVAFLDSSFLPLPGITDLLFIVMVTRRPAAMIFYALTTVVGSLAGCLTLYYVGKKGGEAFVTKRFTGDRVTHATTTLQRNGVMAVLLPSLLPPPSPFKLFVLLAGVVGIGVVKFATAVAIGRGIRYLALGVLAVTYGEAASAYMKENGAVVSLAAVAVLAAGFGAYLWLTKARAGKPR
jgi:membrane protein YqaA with SNARE-associated domain